MEEKPSAAVILIALLVLVFVAACIAVIILSINFEAAFEWEKQNALTEEYEITLNDENVDKIQVQMGREIFYVKFYHVFADGSAMAIEENNAVHKFGNAREIELVIYYKN